VGRLYNGHELGGVALESPRLACQSRLQEAQDGVPTRSISIRKRELAKTLQSIAAHPEPKVQLEQYTIPANLAAEILFHACYVRDDIEDKSVLDMGAGTGRLAIGASILGAEYVIGVDLDQSSLKVASSNCKRLALNVDWLLGDIRNLRGRVDTVLMNPPFGTKKIHADVEFLQVAFDLGRIIYSIHKTATRRFLQDWLQRHGARGAVVVSGDLEIPHQFSFHTREKRNVAVDVFRIERSQLHV